jgi:hypothetical protein
LIDPNASEARSLKIPGFALSGFGSVKEPPREGLSGNFAGCARPA